LTCVNRRLLRPCQIADMSRKEAVAIAGSSRVAAFASLTTEIDAKTSRRSFVAPAQQNLLSIVRLRTDPVARSLYSTPYDTVHFQAAGRMRGFAGYLPCRIAARVKA
jgi:hypothetical protein